MKRVSGIRYLYHRGNSYVFRRGVPSFARAEFGGRCEVQLALKANNLADARYQLAREIVKFDAILNRVQQIAHVDQRKSSPIRIWTCNGFAPVT